MRTSNLHFNPFQTIIQDSRGSRRYLVSTAFLPSGVCDWFSDDLVHWETIVFPYDPESGSPSYGEECDCIRCDSYGEALLHHMQLIADYSADL